MNKVQWGGNLFNGWKKYLVCLGRFQSGKNCAAIENVCVLLKKAEWFTEWFLGTV